MATAHGTLEMANEKMKEIKLIQYFISNFSSLTWMDSFFLCMFTAAAAAAMET